MNREHRRNPGAGGRVMRIAAVGDFHCDGPGDESELREIFSDVGQKADVLLLLGDMTAHGEPDQVETFARHLLGLEIPVIAVLGNHDHEAGQQEKIVSTLEDAGVRVLDGEGVEIDGIGFAGTKGFGGGFGAHALSTFGEQAMKAFVQAAMDEEVKLERALAELRTQTRVVLLHYSPIEDTMGDEPLQIWLFLGSSRLLRPIEAYGASVVFHGHAHSGSPEGRTPAGISVYNVALPLLRRDGTRYRLWAVPAPERRRLDSADAERA